MRGGFASRRSADEFDALVSRAADGRPVGDADYAELLEVVATLRALPEVSARPDFVTDLRSRLMAEAATQPARPRRQLDDALVARLTPSQRRGHNERRLATLLGGFAVVAATGSMAMASQAALPGDVLYPMKRAIENAQTNLQADDAGKAATLLDHAEQRLAEVEALNARGDDSTGEIASTLHDFTEQTNQATSLAIDEYEVSGDQDSLQDVRSFAGRSMGQLTVLGDALPDDARPALITAAQTVRQVDSAAQQACPVCGGSITEIPDFATRSLESLVNPDLPRSTEDTEDTEAAGQPRPDRDLPEREDVTPGRDVEQPDRNPAPTDDDDPPANEDPTDDQPDKDDGRGPLGDVTDGVDGALGGGKDPDDDKGVVGNLVDGVTGLLGGLLGGGSGRTP